MSVILFSHPRSGSSHYTTLLDTHFNQKSKNQSLYLFEFFVLTCTNTFANAGDPLYDSELYGKPVQVYELQKAHTFMTAWNLHLLGQQMKTKKDKNSLILSLLEKKTVIFKNANEVRQWYTIECLHRLRWLKYLTDNNIHYVIKHFVLSEGFGVDKELIEFAKSTQQAKLYYRQDIYQALLSNLIKTYYYDLPAAHLQTLTDRGGDAHNIENKMPPLQPMPIKLERDQLLVHVYWIVLFLKFVKDNKFDDADILLYEDFLAKKSIVINGEEVNLRTLDALAQRHKEFPMNYAVNKDQYFINSELIKSLVHEKIVANHLLETMQMLGIHLS